MVQCPGQAWTDSHCRGPYYDEMGMPQGGEWYAECDCVYTPAEISIKPVIALSGTAAGGAYVPPEQVQYAGVPIVGYTPEQYAAITAPIAPVATVAPVTPEPIINIPAITPELRTPQNAVVSALYTTIQPYFVPIIAGLIVTAIVLILGAMGNGRRTNV